MQHTYTRAGKNHLEVCIPWQGKLFGLSQKAGAMQHTYTRAGKNHLEVCSPWQQGKLFGLCQKNKRHAAGIHSSWQEPSGSVQSIAAG